MKTIKISKMKTSQSKLVLLLAGLFAVTGIFAQENMEIKTVSNAGGDTPSAAEGRRSRAIDTQKEAAEAPKEAVSAKDTAKTEKPFYAKHEFSLWGAGGISTLLYDETFGDRENRYGGAIGLGYTFYFSPHWGIHAGGELAMYNTRIKIDDLHNTEMNVLDQDGWEINYNSVIYDQKEKQRLVNVNIPIMLQFQSSGKHKFYAGLGFKLGIPIYGSYKSFNGLLDAYGYDYKTNQNLYDQRDLGYGTFEGGKAKGDVDFELAYMGMADIGMKWGLSKRVSLYTGVYVDYAFNDVVKNHDETSFVTYNRYNPENFQVNSVLNSTYTQNGVTTEFADKVSPFAVGLKLRLGVNLGKLPSEEKKEEEKKKEDEEDTAPKRKAEPRKAGRLMESNRGGYGRVVPESEIADLRRGEREYGPIRDIIILYVDNYDIDKSDLTPKMKLMLDSRMEDMRRYNKEGYTMILEGHTCDIASDEYNMVLGQKRADKVKDYLVSKGLNGYNIITASKGKRNPVVPNTNETNRRLNRRVVILVKDK